MSDEQKSSELQIGKTRLRVQQGNIVEAGTEAIVNAANPDLAGGAGVDGAIHQAAGRELYELTRPLGGCPTGSAVITGAGRIPGPTRFIIHAVGPIYRNYSPQECGRLLSGAYRTSLELATRQGLKSMAFPSISTGVYGYPITAAAPLVVRTVIEYLENNSNSLEEIVFVLFSAPDLAVYRQVLAGLQAPGR